MRTFKKLHATKLSFHRLLIIGLLLILFQTPFLHSQENSEPLADNKDALKQAIQQILTASRQGEQDRVTALVNDLTIQDPVTFFGLTFEESTAGELATRYSQNTETIETYLFDVFTKFGKEKKTSIRVKRYTKEKDGKPKSGRAKVFANMENPKALYTLELKGSRKTGKRSMWYFIHSNGKFQFASGMNVSNLPIRVSSRHQATKRWRSVRPTYPPEAALAKIEGTVRLEVLIYPEGTIQRIHALSGPPELHEAAIKAVLQWRYEPTLLQGQPVPVITLIDILFKSK